MKLEGFGTKFQLALQVLGISRGVSVTDILDDPKAAVYDVRIWIWKRPLDSWDFPNVDLNLSYFSAVTLCRNPVVEGLVLSINEEFDALIYPTYLLDDELSLIRFDIPYGTERVIISNCKEE